MRITTPTTDLAEQIERLFYDEADEVEYEYHDGDVLTDSHGNVEIGLSYRDGHATIEAYVGPNGPGARVIGRFNRRSGHRVAEIRKTLQGVGINAR